jgi:predicted nuclease of predicted toxin-antitoxin system
VKLLLDENLSDRIVSQILDLYPGSTHIKSHGLMQASDTLIWSFAQQHGYAIVSKDADLHQRSLVFGHPPKLVFLRVGNCPTSRITQLLRTHYVELSVFDADANSSIRGSPVATKHLPYAAAPRWAVGRFAS